MNYASIKPLDVSNSDGIASSIFFSGCRFNCLGCFNKENQDFSYGKPFTKKVENLFISYVNNKHVVCSNILGGEVFQQDLDIIFNFILRLKNETKKPIWVWSGYKWETLIENKNTLRIIQNIDILVDGQFDVSKKDIRLKYRGSSNQRVISVQESLKQGSIIEYNK